MLQPARNQCRSTLPLAGSHEQPPIVIVGMCGPKTLYHTTLTTAATIDPSLIPPILHYSAPEPYTKYEICLVFSKLLGVPISHITPDAEEPTGAAAVSRPRDCQLNTRDTEDLMEGVGGLDTTGFEEWWTEHLHANKA